MKTFKTLRSAKDSVNADTVCTCCGKKASAGFVDAKSGHACVAIIHDNYAFHGVRAKLIATWQAGGLQRLSGIPGAGLIKGR